jgi:hypothetical protein
VALFAPYETVRLQQIKYQRLPNYKNGNPTVHQIIIACSTDGRVRVFVNEKQSKQRVGEEEDDADRINEEEYEEEEASEEDDVFG